MQVIERVCRLDIAVLGLALLWLGFSRRGLPDGRFGSLGIETATLSGRASNRGVTGMGLIGVSTFALLFPVAPRKCFEPPTIMVATIIRSVFGAVLSSSAYVAGNF